MAHCPPELLEEIAEVRRWPGILERSQGVFYLHRQPFLHFHLFEGARRRADVNGPAGWIHIDLLQPVTATRRRDLLREARRQYRERVGRRADDGAATARR